MTIDEAREHIGEAVVYTALDPVSQEDGVITSVANTIVFVRYTGDHHSKATYPRDLDLLAPSPPGLND